MTSNEFSKIEQEWYDMQHSVLGVKADEYATEDRLHNFKTISDLTRGKVTPLQVAMILRGKQVVSLYDRVFSDDPVTTDFFNEKAGDDANYLVLAKALHAEESEEPKKSNMVMPIEYNEETDTYNYWSERYQEWFHDIDKIISEWSILKHLNLVRPRNFYEEAVAHAKEEEYWKH